MSEESQEPLHFAINDTLDSVFAEIVKLIPDIKADWTFTEDKENGDFYSANINGVDLKIYETKAIFTITRGGLNKETRVYQTVTKIGRTRKANKIKLFQILNKRFSQNEDYVFYRRVLRFMNGQLAVQKNHNQNETQFTERLIAQKIRNIIDNIKNRYRDIFCASVGNWSQEEINIFLLNSATEIFYFLDDKNLKLCDMVINEGISYNVIIIIYECMSYFFELYGDDMDIYQKDYVDKKINENIIQYLTYGIGEVDGN